MSTTSAINTGLQGIQTGLNDLKRNAQEIDSATGSNTDSNEITQSLVEIKLNTLQVAASSKVVQAESDMLGTLLDVHA